MGAMSGSSPSDPARRADYVETQALPWRSTPFAGVHWKKLAHAPGGLSSVLLRFEPGASYGAHRHPAGEQYLVLEGRLEDGGRSWGPGSYVNLPPGSSHRPTSAAGCLLFVTLPAAIELLDG